MGGGARVVRASAARAEAEAKRLGHELKARRKEARERLEALTKSAR